MGLASLLIGILLISVFSVYMYTGGFSSDPKQNTVQAPLNQTKDAEIKAHLSQIKTALLSYKVLKGEYPDNLNQLKSEKVLSDIPNNPITNTPYEYQIDNGVITLSTTLSDGSPYQISF